MPIQILSVDETLSSERDPLAFWPTKPEQQTSRLSPMCLPAIRPSFTITKDDLIFTIGSCFARNIEKQLVVEDFNVAVRSFSRICAEEGVDVKDDILNKFVAGSIYNEVKWALDPDESYDERSIVLAGRPDKKKYLDMHLAPGMMPAKLETVQAVRRAVSRYMALLKEAKVIIITLGLAEAWYDKEAGIYLNRAPQRSSADIFPGRFELHVLSYQDIVEALEGTIDCLKKHGRPDFRIVLTVSPVAMGMTWTDDDAMVANCYSKSVQRAAASFIYKKYDCVDYLPSYESVTLSDRRVAWRDDAAHVSDDAVRMNVLRMLYAYSGTQGDDEKAQKRAVALQLARDADTAIKDGRSADAMQSILLAKEAAPDEVMVMHKLGALLLAEGKFNEAITALTKARDLGGAHYGASEQLGVALIKSGRPADAIPFLEEATGLGLKASKAARYLAEAYAASGNPEKAVDFLLHVAIPAAPKKAALAFVAASILAKLGRLKDAAEMARLAVEEAPDVEKYANLRRGLDQRLATA